MIALCGTCHDVADEGHFSVEQLRQLKTTKADFVRGRFPNWELNGELLVRVAGCYMDSRAPILLVNGIPQLALSQTPRGTLSLTFALRDKSDRLCVQMRDNWLEALSIPHDMTIKPNTRDTKIWIDKDDVGLEFEFRRLGIADLERKYLARDFKMYEATSAKEARRRRFEQSETSEDSIGDCVKSWVLQNCFNESEQDFPFLNFKKFVINFHGCRVDLLHTAGNAEHCCFFGSRVPRFNFVCECEECELAPPVQQNACIQSRLRQKR